MKTLLASVTLIFFSCATPNYHNYLDNDINYYDVKAKDTILDLGYDEHIADPLLATQIDSLHFYFLVVTTKGKKVKRFSSSFQNNSFLFRTNTHPTASEVRILGDDSIALPSNSVDKIIFRNYLWFFHKDKIVKELLRLLKEDGTLIIVQEETRFKESNVSENSIPVPRENSVREYYEKYGFVMTKTITGVQSPYRKRFLHFQLHFKKKRGK